MKNNLFILSALIIALTFSCISCKTKHVYANPVVSKESRINYYKPYSKSAQFETKIYALNSINAVHKAANNFNMGEVFIVNNDNDSLYVLKNTFRQFYLKNKTDKLLKNNITHASVAAVKKFEQFKIFLDSDTKLAYTTGQTNKNGNLSIYLMYSTEIKEKFKQENLPLSHFTDIKELVIVDVSIDKE